MDDLQDLLDELEEKPTKVWSDGIIEQSELMGKVEGIEEVADIEDINSAIISTDTPPITSTIDPNKYFARLDGVTEEILSSCRSDRQEAQDVIQMLRQQIEESLNQNKTPSRMFIDGLVKAVEVKANINMTAVKIMEANAKMLASVKASTNVSVNNQNVSVGSTNYDLERILDEPMTSDDEY